jgi:AraC family transcriptional regulator
VDFIELPAARMIGMEVVNGGGNNPVPALWESIFSQNKLAALNPGQALLDLYVGWMGEYKPADQTFTYIAGYMMPAGTLVPDGFAYRDIAACRIGLGTINGGFANGDVFAHSHNMTVEGITKAGCEPDYAFGWSAEAYPRDLSFQATEGTIHYICPCKP